MPIERLDADDLREPRLADYANLTDVALRRRLEPAGGLYIAESGKVIARALRAGHHPRSILALADRVEEATTLLRGAGVETTVFVADPAVLESITGFDVHRGLLASMRRPELPDAIGLLEHSNRVLILEDIVDHTNLGAIFRSAAALGADAVLLTPRCADPLYRRAVRVSMGAVFQVPWTRIDWPAGFTQVRQAGLTLAALALDPNAVELDELTANPPARLALMLGTEGDGLSRRARRDADVAVRIAMAGDVDSLNVAAAAAVALHALRPRPAATIGRRS